MRARLAVHGTLLRVRHLRFTAANITAHKRELEKLTRTQILFERRLDSRVRARADVWTCPQATFLLDGLSFSTFVLL